MPFYEFYCPGCHRLFDFFSRRVNTDKRPACPRCGRPELERQPSRFAISRNRPEPAAPGGMPDGDEAAMERALTAMAGEIEGLDENDPRAMGRVMRRLFDATGMRLGEGMAEALRRMEAGEDPEQVEAELGAALEAEDPFQAGVSGLRTLRRQYLPPSKDEQIFEL